MKKCLINIKHEVADDKNMENSSLKTNGTLHIDNLKRVESVKQRIKTYHQQKLAIKDALSRLDKTPKNKIVFNTEDTISNDINGQTDSKQGTKQRLFLDSDNDEDISFQLKEQFEGEKGQQLFHLQSKFKGDKRFALDSRFIEKEGSSEDYKADINLSLEEEKKNDINILEKILGTTLSTNDNFKQKMPSEKKMLRFNPIHSDHLQQFQLIPPIKSKKTFKRVQREQEMQNQPQVSKDIFYKVSTDLKNNFQNQSEYSLLTTYGREASVNEGQSIEDDQHSVTVNYKDTLLLENNPFKYDSSEDEVEDTQEENTFTKDQNSNNLHKSAQFLLESFFFKEDDYRYQDGTDFVNRIASENNIEFVEQRRNLKTIIRAKVKNSVRKRNPFRQKLGGSKRKKNIKMKKALRR